MAARTGTASQVDASGGDGSTTVTVPADATAAIAFWAHYDGDNGETLASLTLGGNAFATQAELGSGATVSETGTGVAVLTSLPGSGSQTLAWTWSAGGARSEGGGLLIVWVKDVDLASLVRDSDVNAQVGSGSIAITIDSASTDLVLAFSQSFTGTNPDGPATVFLNDWAVNSEVYDASEATPGATTTTLTCATSDYGSIAGISLRAAAAPAAEIAVDAATESVRTGTTDPHTFSHTGAATINGVVLAVIHGTSSTDHVVSATYGGVALSRINTAVDTATELGRADLWFVGTGLAGKGGTQTVSVDLASATTDDIEFVVVTLVTGSGRDVEVIDSDLLQENQADPSVTLQYGGRFAVAIAALYGGGAAPSSFTPNANCVEVASHDFGAFYGFVLRQTTPGTADFAIGGTASSDDVAYVAAAFAQKPARAPAPEQRRRRYRRLVTM